MRRCIGLDVHREFAEVAAYGRPSLLAHKLRAGMPSRRGQRGSTHAYNLKEVRARERALSEQGEIAYRQLVADWRAKATRRAGRGCRHRGATLRPSSGNPARRGFHPHAPLFRSGVTRTHHEA